MITEISHGTLSENGTFQRISNNVPPSEGQVNGASRLAKIQGQGLYMAKITGSARQGGTTVEQHGDPINKPKFSFETAKANYLARQSGANANRGSNTVFANIG